MNGLMKFAKSSIGAKVVMALTGAMLVGFVMVHLLGNSLVFAGPEKLNAYAATLQGLGSLKWVARVGLLAAAAAHIASGLRLKALNLAARPEAYKVKTNVVASVQGRSMALSGVVVGAFLVYHLLHFTLGVAHAQYYGQLDAQGHHDVYRMVVLSFQQPLVAGSYIVAIVLLGMHLHHGIASMFQSLGLRTPRFASLLDAVGKFIALVLVLGNIAMPIAVQLGMINLLHHHVGG